MCSTHQNCHKSSSRQSLGVFSIPLGMKEPDESNRTISGCFLKTFVANEKYNN